MPTMAIFRSAIRDARRDIARRLMVAGAIFCLLTMSAHAQTAGAAPTPADHRRANAGRRPAGHSARRRAALESARRDERTPGRRAPLERRPRSTRLRTTRKQVVESQQQLVTRTEQQFGKRSRQAAEAYFDLAEAQRRAGDHAAAEKSYLAAIDTLPLARRDVHSARDRAAHRARRQLSRQQRLHRAR